MVYIQRKQGSFLMCIKYTKRFVCHITKITALPVNFRNNIITHRALRITHKITLDEALFLVYNRIKALNNIDRKAQNDEKTHLLRR